VKKPTKTKTGIVVAGIATVLAAAAAVVWWRRRGGAR
jgi:hypothetical protein